MATAASATPQDGLTDRTRGGVRARWVSHGARLSWRWGCSAGRRCSCRGSRARWIQARTRIEQGASPVDPAVQGLVGQALARDVTTPAAIELAALGREAAGERPAAVRLYALSDAISRRSLATRLWLVQAAVARGDVTATLTNMDIALRTSTAAPDIVFLALARGLEDPALVAPIAALVDRPSDWRAAFLAYATTNARPEAAASLRAGLCATLARSPERGLDRKLLVRLVDAGPGRVGAGGSRRNSRHLPTNSAAHRWPTARSARSSARYPFGWGLSDAHALGAARATDGGHSGSRLSRADRRRTGKSRRSC